MRNLILVKHSLPEIDPATPASEWRLSAEGRRRCIPLAQHLQQYTSAAIVASREPKATETAALIARQLHLPFDTQEGLHENDRTGFPFVSTARLHATIAEFFTAPHQLIMGRETAAQAGDRFTRAIDRALTAHPDGNLVVVAHGTVISLFVAQRAGIEPFGLWQRLGLPSFVVLDLPGYALLTVVEAADENDHGRAATP